MGEEMQGRIQRQGALLGALVLAGGLALACGLGCEASESSDWPAGVGYLSSPFAGAVQGNLASGAPLDLAFAAKASMACFVEPANGNYAGNHVLYGFTVAGGTPVTVRVTPKGGQDISLYAYRMGATRYDIPPSVASAVSCEASPSSSNNANGAGQAESVKFSAANNPYNFVVGVAGPAGSSGAFELEILAQ